MCEPDRERDERLTLARTLTSPRLDLEPLRIDHAEEMAVVLDDAALHTFTGGRPQSPSELRAQYERQVVGHSPDGSQRWLNWVIRRRDDGRAVGTLQATITHESDRLVAEVAWAVAVAFQHRGYAREGAQVLVTWLREQAVTIIRAHVHPDHLASQGVAQAIGMSPTEIMVDGENRWQV